MRKASIHILCLVLVCFLFVSKRTIAQEIESNVLRLHVDCIRLRCTNLSRILSIIATTYKVPISFESEYQKSISISEESENVEDYIPMTDGTLEDVLNNLIKTEPGLTWNLEDGVIRVFPISDRDIAIDNILNTHLDSFTFRASNCKTQLGSLIFSTPEVKSKLIPYGLRSLHFCDASTLLSGSSQQSSYEFSGLTVRDILNQLVKRSSLRFWTVYRWGKENSTVTLVTG